MSNRISKVAILVLSLWLSAAVVFAWLADPATYFTDNMASSGVSLTITPMEQALLDLINGATVSIDATMYDFNRTSISDALIAAHNRGVTVRIVTDDEARFMVYIPEYEALETAGIALKDDEREISIMHNKYFIVDGQTVWTGSTNISNNGFTVNHNNALVFDSAAVATIYQADFDQMWAGTFSVHKTASLTTATTYQGKPLQLYFSPEDEAMAKVVAEVDQAECCIQFAIFFLTHDGLRDALIAAHNRGVQIQGVWDTLGASNTFSDDEALCAAGIPIKIENTLGKMHHKFMTIDAAGSDPRLVTGSMNWSNAGDNHNDENTVIYHDLVASQAYSAAFQTMWAALEPATQCETSAPGEFVVYLPLVVGGGAGGAAPSAVEIQSIVYNPAGSDAEGEVVQLINNSGLAQDITGWTLTDEASTQYTFPAFSLASGATVRVWVRSGTNTAGDLYWGRNSAVWNNGGDTAFLADGTGTPVDSCAYPGGETEAVC